MILSQAPVPCATGSWSQKWTCGLHEPAGTAFTHAGYSFGHSGEAFLAVGALIGILLLISRARRRRTPSTG